MRVGRLVKVVENELHRNRTTLQGVSLIDGKLNFASAEAFYAYARAAFHIDRENPNHLTMFTLFNVADLDEHNPLHWRMLLSLLGELYLAPPKTKPKSSMYNFYLIYKDYAAVKKKHPSFTETAICEQLRRHQKSRYGKYQIDALRKLVRKARSKKYNLVLRYPDTSGLFVRGLRARLEYHGHSWTDENALIVSRLLRLAEEQLGKIDGKHLDQFE
jgi:hypothetical protein